MFSGTSDILVVTINSLLYGHYFLWEIWEDKHPENVIESKILILSNYKMFLREGVPPNALSQIIKPVFDKNIKKIRHAEKQGESIVYHSPLRTPTLETELSKFEKLLIRFYNGEFYNLLSEFSDKKPGWDYHKEITVPLNDYYL